MVEALAEVGALDEARVVCARLRELSEQQAHPWGLASTKRCEALIALAGDRYDAQAAEQMAVAADGYRHLGLHFDAARSLLALGRAARRFKQWGLARSSLEQAAAAFDQIGSSAWSEQARSQLTRAGARRARVRAS